MSLYERPDLYDSAFGDGDEEAAFFAAILGTARRVVVGGCGTGRVSSALANRGFDVVGFDLSLAMLRAARRHPAVAARFEAPPFAAGCADAFVAPLLGFAYVADVAGIDAALDAFARIVRDGGVLALELPVAHRPERLQGVEEAATLPDGVEYSFRYLDLEREDGDFAVLHTTMRVATDGEAAERSAPLAVWRPDGIRRRLENGGCWRNVRCFAPYDVDSATDIPPSDCLRAIVVAERSRRD